MSAPPDVVVVGGGIGGLVAALSLHEVGVPVRVVEAVVDLKPLGVGINLQPHAVRELEERAPEGFDRLDDVVSPDELAALSEEYRTLAGGAVDELDGRPSLLARTW